MNRKIIAIVAILGLLSTASKCNFSLLGSPTQGDYTTKEKNATPTPTPDETKIDSSCKQTCEVDSIVIDEGDSVIALGASKEFNATPYTRVSVCDASGKPTGEFKKVKTTKECDDPRAAFVQWQGSSNAISVLGDGFKATVTRKGSGDSTLTVSLEGKSFSRSIK